MPLSIIFFSCIFVILEAVGLFFIFEDKINIVEKGSIFYLAVLYGKVDEGHLYLIPQL